MTITNMIAHINDGRLRVAERRRRNGIAMYIGIRFRAAKEDRHNAPMNPRMVETKAILIVSIIPR